MQSAPVQHLCISASVPATQHERPTSGKDGNGEMNTCKWREKEARDKKSQVRKKGKSKKEGIDSTIISRKYMMEELQWLLKEGSGRIFESDISLENTVTSHTQLVYLYAHAVNLQWLFLSSACLGNNSK